MVIDYLGRIDGEPFEGGEGRDQLLELGSGRLIPGFEEQLSAPARASSARSQVTFPEDYPSELGGEDAEFEVTVTEVKAKRLPELDDEFAAEAAGFDTLEELREDIGARLRETDERAIEREFEEAVLDAAVAEARDRGARPARPCPRARAAGADAVGARAPGHLQGGLPADRRQGRGDAGPRGRARGGAALRREAVLAAIVEAEEIEPTDERDPARRSSRRPSAASTTAEKLLEQLRKDGRLERLREDVATRQALELLVARPSRSASSRPRRARSSGRRARRASRGAGQLWTPGS